MVVLMGLAGCASRGLDTGFTGGPAATSRSTGSSGTGSSGTGSPAPIPTQVAAKPPAGWRTESSLGMAISVPGSWKVNDTGCGQDAAPTVIRGSGAVLDCLSPTPPKKEYAQIAAASMPAAQALGDDAKMLTGKPGTVSGLPASIAGGPVSNGMYAGWIISADRDIALYVRVQTRATLDQIMSSATIQRSGRDDHNCPIDRPAARPQPAEPASASFAPEDVYLVSVCYYTDQPRIQASTTRTDAAATSLADALNKTIPGTYAGPGQCLPQPAETDVLLILVSSSVTAEIDVTFQPCRFRLDNGSTYHQLHRALLAQIMQGMYVGYATPDN